MKDAPSTTLPETIWIVTASVGEYSDRSEWAAAAYLREDDAKAHVEAASAISREAASICNRMMEGDIDWDACDAFEKQVDELLGGFNMYGGEGPTFYVGSVPLRGAFTPMTLPDRPETARHQDHSGANQ